MSHLLPSTQDTSDSNAESVLRYFGLSFSIAVCLPVSSEDTICVRLSRVSAEDQKILAGPLKEMASAEPWDPCTQWSSPGTCTLWRSTCWNCLLSAKWVLRIWKWLTAQLLHPKVTYTCMNVCIWGCEKKTKHFTISDIQASHLLIWFHLHCFW